MTLMKENTIEEPGSALRGGGSADRLISSNAVLPCSKPGSNANFGNTVSNIVAAEGELATDHNMNRWNSFNNGNKAALKQQFESSVPF
jgi:hypothetical protein